MAVRQLYVDLVQLGYAEESVRGVVGLFQHSSFTDSFEFAPTYRQEIKFNCAASVYSFPLMPSDTDKLYEIVLYSRRGEVCRLFFSMPNNDAFLHQLETFTTPHKHNVLIRKRFVDLEDTPNQYKEGAFLTARHGRLVWVDQIAADDIDLTDSLLKAALDAKADKTYVDSRFNTQNQSIDGLQDAISQRATIQYVNNSLANTATKPEIQAVDSKINQEILRAKQAEQQLQNNINAVSGGYFGGFGTLAELQSKIPDKANAVAEVLDDPSHNPNANPPILINGAYYFRVPDGEPLENGEWVYGHSDTQMLLDKLKQANDYTNEEITERKSLIYLNEIGAIIDDFGFVIARVDPTLNLLEMRVSLLVQTINSRDATFRVVDEYGFGIDIFNIINAIKQKIAELQNAGSTFAAIDVSKPLIVKNYAVWSGETLSLDVSSLLQDKAYQRQFEQVIATVNNLTTNTESSSKVKLNIAATTSTAKFSLRDVKDQSNRSLLNVNIFNVPNNTTALKILMIGDSITDTSGGAALTNYFLSQHTYAPTFIGTKKGVSQTINGITAASQNDEARAGWKAANYTNTETKTAVSDVATYLALSDADKRTYNPFIRPTATGDDASLIKNGYVFDVADYLSKFSLDTPDVIYIGLGTNDITYSNFGERDAFAAQFYIDMKIIVSQCRVAAPSAKIILSIPPTAFTADRNLLWESHYYYAIRVLQRLATEYSNVVVAPLYALSAAEIDYNFTAAATDSISGVQYGAISDPVHPRNAVLYQTYNVLSAYIAAAINDQI